MGDPTNATAENGERWVNEAASKIAEILVGDARRFVPRHDA